jgi:hypothetical protein
VGKVILSEHKAFEGYNLSMFNEKIKKHDIDYVLQNIEGDDIDKS